MSSPAKDASKASQSPDSSTIGNNYAAKLAADKAKRNSQGSPKILEHKTPLASPGRIKIPQNKSPETPDVSLHRTKNMMHSPDFKIHSDDRSPDMRYPDDVLKDDYSLNSPEIRCVNSPDTFLVEKIFDLDRNSGSESETEADKLNNGGGGGREGEEGGDDKLHTEVAQFLSISVSEEQKKEEEKVGAGVEEEDKFDENISDLFQSRKSSASSLELELSTQGLESQVGSMVDDDDDDPMSGLKKKGFLRSRQNSQYKIQIGSTYTPGPIRDGPPPVTLEHVRSDSRPRTSSLRDRLDADGKATGSLFIHTDATMLSDTPGGKELNFSTPNSATHFLSSELDLKKTPQQPSTPVSRKSLIASLNRDRTYRKFHESYDQQRLSGLITDLASTVIPLARGGSYVQTKAGPIQFGIPPESIKDCMKLGLTLPTQYVLPKHRFDLNIGLNTAEFEFPAYYSFFFKRQQVNIITHREVEPFIRTIFQETLLGPVSIPLPTEYSEKVPKEVYPDLEKELRAFRRNPFQPGTDLSVDTLLRFTYFEKGVATLDNGVTITEKDDEYIIQEGGDETARVKSFVFLRPPEKDDGPAPGAGGGQTATATPVNVPDAIAEATEGEEEGVAELDPDGPPAPYVSKYKQFVPPYFGITMLGNSDGFDKNGTTTGFVLWMNRRGIMVDPPPHSDTILLRHGIPKRLIHAIIITHCHADHDAGAFQRILAEGRISVMTTPVIMGSFCKKYSAISGLPVSFLRKLFVYRPVVVGSDMSINGGHLRFFYSLHSIPCMGFEAYCNGKSMVYSADTFNDPAGIQKFFEQGVMSAGRRDALINFPWHHDIILHEAGVPPIHTPFTTFEPLSDDIKKRLFIVHKSPASFPAGHDPLLKSALTGPENTIVICDKPGDSFQAMEILDLVASIELFSNYALSRGLDFIECAEHRKYHAGDVLIAENTPGSTLFVMAMGIVSVRIPGKGIIKTLTVGDHFGEMSILTGELRTATVIAETEVETFEYSKNEFFHLTRLTDTISRLEHLCAMQQHDSWQAMNANSVLNRLSSSQKTYLQSIFNWKQVKAGDVVWQAGEACTEAVLVESGQFAYSEAIEALPFQRGAFLGYFHGLINDHPLTTTLVCLKDGLLYFVSRYNLLRFFKDNPGVQLQCMKKVFVE